MHFGYIMGCGIERGDNETLQATVSLFYKQSTKNLIIDLRTCCRPVMLGKLVLYNWNFCCSSNFAFQY